MELKINNKIVKTSLALFFIFLSFILLRLLFRESLSGVEIFGPKILIFGIFLTLAGFFNSKEQLYFLIALGPIFIFLSPDRFIYALFFEEVFMLLILVWIIGLFFRTSFSGHTKFNLNATDVSIIFFFLFAFLSSIYVSVHDEKLSSLIDLGLERIASSWQGQLFYNFRRTFTILEGLLAYLFVRENFKKEDLGEIKYFFTISVLSCAIFALINHVLYDTSSFYHGLNRARSVFANPNSYGTFALLGLPFSIWLLLDANRKKLFSIKITSFVICLLGLIISYSKGAWLGFVAFLFLLFAFKRKTIIIKHKKWIFAFIGISLTITLLLCVIYISSHQPVEVERISHGRYYIWSAGLNMFFSSPIFGIGAGEFYSKTLYYYPEGIRPWANHEHAHNLFIQNIAEFGIIGAGLLFFSIFYPFLLFFNNFRKSNLDSVIIFGALLGILVHSLIDYTLLSAPLSIFFFILLGLANNIIRKNY